MATQGHQTAHEHGGEGRMCYVFGDCELDAARCELRCASKTVLVEPKIFNEPVWQYDILGRTCRRVLGAFNDTRRQSCRLT